MFEAFQHFIKQEKLFDADSALLIAVSGGLDSVVLLQLLNRLVQEVPEFSGLRLGIAHCNFSLRGKESDDEEFFVESLSKQYGLPYYTNRFDTQYFAQTEKVSIQMAARALRYEWFEKIRNQNNYQYITAAHHQNDAVETVLINLIKGTGIAGLHGIASKKDLLIRPLLFATRKEISQYAIANNIHHKEDSSNSSTKYIRNKIRHEVIPVLTAINPHIEKTFQQNIERIRDVELIFQQFIEAKKIESINQDGDSTYIHIEKIKLVSGLPTVLFEILRYWQFNAGTVSDILECLDKQAGKLFFSPTHRLLKDREYLVINPINKEENTPASYSISAGQTEHQQGINLQFQNLKKENINTFQLPSFNALLDCDLLHFPLTLRKWQAGDSFYPFGMKHQKKLSDFFIDKKISLAEKEKIWVLLSENKIVWVIGFRIDDRFKITAETKNVLFVSKI
jgi:tRNA(Ile)-lysidine synthase